MFKFPWLKSSRTSNLAKPAPSPIFLPEGGEKKLASDTFADMEDIAGLAFNKGYQALTEAINKKIASAAMRLTRDNCSDMREIALLQGEIRGLQSVISYVNTRVEKLKKENEKNGK